VRLAAWVLLGLVMAVLLIACANVTSLCWRAAQAGEKELAVRSALGSEPNAAGPASVDRVVYLVCRRRSLPGVLFAGLLLRLFIAMAPDGMPFLSKAAN